MQVWHITIILVGVLLILFKMIKICRHVGNQKRRDQENANNRRVREAAESRRVYLVEDGFLVVDQSLSSSIDGDNRDFESVDGLPSYADAENPVFVPPPPPYEPPPAYSEVVCIRESPEIITLR